MVAWLQPIGGVGDLKAASASMLGSVAEGKGVGVRRYETHAMKQA